MSALADQPIGRVQRPLIAIIAALKQEVSAFLSRGGFSVAERSGRSSIHRSSQQHGVAVVLSGMGRDNASRAAEWAVEKLRPELIVSTGFAGAVRPGLGTGDLLVYDELTAADGPPDRWFDGPRGSIQVGEESWRAEIVADLSGRGYTCRTGKGLTVSRLVETAALKQRIAKTFAVDAVDMESYWVMTVAARNGVPFVAARAVLDAADQTLPPFVGLVSRDRRLRWVAGLVHLIARPHETPALFRLAKQASVARAALDQLLGSAVRQESRSATLLASDR